MESQARVFQDTEPGYYLYSSQGFYQSQSSAELTIRLGSVLGVQDKRPNGWWYVQDVTGQRGWVPGCFLEPIKDLEQHLGHHKHWGWVKRPPLTVKMAKIPCHPPSEFPPGLLRLSAPAENMAEETNLPAGHTIWLTAPTPRPIPDKIVRHKLVVAGPPKSGKTKSLMAFAHGTWFDDHPYRAAVFEPYITDTEVDGTHVELVLTEAPANEDYLRLRPLSYQDASVVVLAFAIDRPESLEDACAFWVSEATHYCPDVPTVLVGLKEDLRRDPLTIRELAKRDQNPVSYQQGLAAARYVGAAAYVEFSAKTGEGVQTAFEAAEKLALYWPGEPRKQALGGKNPLKGACSVM